VNDSVRLENRIQISYRYLHPNIVFISLFGLVTHPLYYAYLQFSGGGVHDSLTLRIVSVAVVIPGLFHRRIERSRFGRFFPLYSIVAIAVALPFFFTQSLLTNAYLGGSDSQIQTWQLQYVFALIGTVLFIYDRVVLIVVLVSSTLVALMLHFIQFGSIVDSSLLQNYYRLIPFYVFMVAAGIYFNRNREVVHQEKMAVANTIGNTIAHELRTPLFSIRSRAQGLMKYLPRLVDSYLNDQRLSESEGAIPKGKLRSIETALRDIDRDVETANIVIDMLLVSSREYPFVGTTRENINATDLVIGTLDRYPFANEKERRLMSMCLDHDFEIQASKILLEHVLFNLVKNALYHVQKTENGVIQIGLARECRIYVRDTGPGIPQHNLKKIFERFFTTTEVGQGSGIGLSYCKQVMESIGGKISVESEEGKYAVFNLDFPQYEK